MESRIQRTSPTRSSLPLPLPSAEILPNAQNASSELAALLSEGRVLSGKVLSALGQGSFLLGVEGYRIPAESELDLQPGQKLSMRVERSTGQTVLRVLSSELSAQPTLLAALRSVVGEDLPLGELLGRLAASLRGAQASESEHALLKDLEAHLFRPRAGTPDLAGLLRSSGYRYESALLSLTLGNSDLEAIFRSALSDLVAELTRGDPEARARLSDSSFQRVLANMASQLASGDASSRELEGLLQRLREDLARALGRPTRGAASDVIAERLAQLGGQGLSATRAGSFLRALLVAREALAEGQLDPALRSVLEGDLKGRLLRALSELPEGPVREAVARTVAGIEAEQLLNLARREFGEALHWSLPVPDHGRWATAHFLYQRGEGGGEGADPESGTRLVVGVDFSRLGPVRADILSKAGRLTVKLSVAQAALAQRLRSDLGELSEMLGGEAQSVRLSVVESDPHEADVDDLAHDIRLLREQHLMDVSG